MTPLLTKSELHSICAHAVKTFPKECCGFVLRRGLEARVVYCRNVAPDPQSAYLVHPRDLKQLAKSRANRWTVHAVYHSHTLRPHAVLSEEDVRGAVQEGGLVFPGAAQVVLSFEEGCPQMVCGYTWDDARQAFLLSGTLRFTETGYRQLAVLPLVEVA